jgi:hypothetical protein
MPLMFFSISREAIQNLCLKVVKFICIMIYIRMTRFIILEMYSNIRHVFLLGLPIFDTTHEPNIKLEG